MRIYLKILGSLTSLLILLFITHMIGCSEQGSVTSFEQDKLAATIGFEEGVSKKVKDREPYATLELTDDYTYPQSVSGIATFKKGRNIYNGSACQLPNRSSFEFENGALTPPPDHPWGEPVMITMMAEKDPLTNELIFTFGPSGCTFETAAQVWLNWADLGIEKARLYYLDSNGNRIEELPEQIDVYNRQMCIRINHFSRYALAYSN